MIRAIVLFVALLAISSYGLHAQFFSRNANPRRIPYVEATYVKFPMRTTLLARNRQEDSVIYATFGDQLWWSLDQGKSWSRINNKDNASLLINASLTFGQKDKHLVCDQMLTNYPISVYRLEDDSLSLVSFPMHIRKPGKIPQGGFLSTSRLRVAFLDDDSIDVEWPGNTTWESFPFLIEEVSYAPDRMYYASDSAIGILLTDTTTVLICADTRVPLVLHHQKGIRQIGKITDSLLLAWRTVSSNSSTLLLSKDGGSTWETLCGLVGERARFTWLKNFPRILVTTSLGFNYLVDHKAFNVDSIGRAFNSQELDSTLIGNRAYMILSARLPADTFVTVQTNTLRPIELVALSDRNLVANSLHSMFYSVDGGHSWTFPFFDDSCYNVSSVRGPGVSAAMPTRLQANGDREVIGYYLDAGAIVKHLPTTDLYVSGVQAANSRSSDFSDPETVKYGLGVVDVRGIDYTYESGDVLGAQMQGRDVIFDYSDATPKGQSMYFIDSRGLVVFSDSMYISRDTGRTWHAVRTLLPTYDASIVSVSSFITTDANVWYTGHRGYSYADADSTVVVTGGIYSSADSGLNWKQAVIDVDFNPYVWQVLSLKSGTILASIGNIVGEVGLTRLTEKGHYLARSTDGGRTFARVATIEERDHPASGLGHRIVEAANGTVFAIGQDVILQSRSDGSTWDTVYVGNSLNGFFTDLVAPSDTCIWLGSNEGLVKLTRSPIMGVDVETKYTFTSLWAYPTPTKDQLSIRINNMSASGSHLMQLRLYSLVGETVLDLSKQLLSIHGSSGVLMVSTSDIQPGIYMLVLTGQGVREYQKIAISH